jgi:hypothetical protein
VPPSPSSVVGIAGATQITASSEVSCALVAGAARCWGLGGDVGNGAFSPLAFLPSDAKFNGHDDDRLVMFVRGGDGALWTRRLDHGSWTGWSSLGGYITSGASAIALPGGGYVVVARGGDNAVWKRSFDGSTWSPWSSLGGYLTSGPAVNADGLVAARGGDGALWIRSLASSGWLSLGGYIIGDPATQAEDDFGAMIFAVRGGDDAVWVLGVRTERSGDTYIDADWHRLGGRVTSAPTLAPLDGNVRPSIFSTRLSARGGDGALWSTDLRYGLEGAIDGGNPVYFGCDSGGGCAANGTGVQGWSSQGGLLNFSPANVPLGGGRADTFVVGRDGAVWRQSPAGWSSLGGYATSSPTVVPTI